MAVDIPNQIKIYGCSFRMKFPNEISFCPTKDSSRLPDPQIPTLLAIWVGVFLQNLWQGVMSCETANFWAFLINCLVNSQFHLKSGMETETRHLHAQQVALTKNSVVIKRGENMNKGENTETGYTLKKGKHTRIPKNKKKSNSHCCLSYSSCSDIS